jgi:hypothetical protein
MNTPAKTRTTALMRAGLKSMIQSSAHLRRARLASQALHRLFAKEEALL